MGVVGCPVEGVDNPEKLRFCLFFQVLLGQDAVIWEVLTERRGDKLLGGEVSLGGQIDLSFVGDFLLRRQAFS